MPQLAWPQMTPGELTRRTPLPRHEAERLLAVAMGMPRNRALTRPSVTGVAVAAYRDLVARRRDGEPLQYLEGSVPFGPIEVAVDPRVLIPRAETEQLFALVASWGPPRVVVDMCTGSGCLGIALGATFPDAAVHLTDLSSPALEVAAANATSNGVRASLWEGDCFDALPDELRGRVDRFVANPPYVTETEYAALEPQIRDHEPRQALVAGVDGLDVLTRIARDLPAWLSPDGSFAIEVGAGQASVVATAVAGLRYEIVRDDFGRDRFVVGGRAG